MATRIEEEQIEKIKGLRPLLPKKSNEELEQILMYGKEVIAEGKKKKKEWWNEHNINDFKMLLKYKWEHQKELEKEYKYLDKMNEAERQKFVAEYLYDDILYRGKIEEGKKEEKIVHGRAYGKNFYLNMLEERMYLNFQSRGIGDKLVNQLSKLKLKIGVTFDLSDNQIGDEGAKNLSGMELKEGVGFLLSKNQIGDEGAEAISHMKLKEGMRLELRKNQIGDKGVMAIAKNMKLKVGVKLDLGGNKFGNGGLKALSFMGLKDGVSLYLHENQIGDKGAETIAQNMKLKEGVELNLSDNQIGDKGAEAIMKMELKNGVVLDLSNNRISKNMKDALKKWGEERTKKGIKCTVTV